MKLCGNKRGSPTGGVRSRTAVVLSAALASMLALLVVALPSAEAVLGPDDSVYRGAIRFSNYTGYDYEAGFARSTWNNVGRINIYPVYPQNGYKGRVDVKLADVYDPDSAYVGKWIPLDGTDLMIFNRGTYEKFGYTQFDRSGTAVHEFGHALGMAHPSGSTPSAYWKANSIMYYSTRESFNTPRTYDINEYHRRWG